MDFTKEVYRMKEYQERFKEIQKSLYYFTYEYYSLESIKLELEKLRRLRESFLCTTFMDLPEEDTRYSGVGENQVNRVIEEYNKCRRIISKFFEEKMNEIKYKAGWNEVRGYIPKSFSKYEKRSLVRGIPEGNFLVPIYTSILEEMKREEDGSGNWEIFYSYYKEILAFIGYVKVRALDAFRYSDIVNEMVREITSRFTTYIQSPEMKSGRLKVRKFLETGSVYKRGVVTSTSEETTRLLNDLEELFYEDI